MDVSGQLHAPGTHCIGGWVGPTAGLDAMEKIKSYPCRESNPGRPARRTMLSRLGNSNLDLWGKYIQTYKLYSWTRIYVFTVDFR
jgi:hypothetical protein